MGPPNKPRSGKPKEIFQIVSIRNRHSVDSRSIAISRGAIRFFYHMRMSRGGVTKIPARSVLRLLEASPVPILFCDM
jgi:hypothetical protein